MKPDDIPAWLDKSGGYTQVYRDRLDRLRGPKDKIADRYLRYLALPPLEQRDIPEWLSGFEGEIVISANINRATGRLEYRSVWQRKGSQFSNCRLGQSSRHGPITAGPMLLSTRRISRSRSRMR